MMNQSNRMTSLEIAELSGKKHKDVMKAIRNMEPSWAEVTGRNFALSEYKDKTGRSLPCYSLTKTECLYVATKFNDEARARLVLRWENLERAERERQMAEAHLLESKCGLLEAMCEELRPRAEFAQAVLCSEDTMTVTQIAQDYGVGAVSLNQLLRHMRIQRRTGGQWVLYGQYQGSCYVRSFAVYRVDQNDGHVSINPLTRWTQLGRHFIYEQLKTRLGILPNTPEARPRILAILKEAREKGGAA